MSLPAELKARKQSRHHALIKDLAAHIKSVCDGVLFMGTNYESFGSTLEELVVQVKAFRNDYEKDYFNKEEPNVQSLSAWKQQNQLTTNGTA